MPAPSSRPHSFTVLSCPLLAIHLPSELTSTLRTLPEWPLSVLASAQSSAENILTFLSKPLDTKKVPDFFGFTSPFSSVSGFRPTAGLSIPLNQRRSETTPRWAPTPPTPRTMRTSQHFTQPSPDPESTRYPSTPQSNP